MYQIAHIDDDHEMAAVAMCWSRLCFDPLIRSHVTKQRSGLYLYSTVCQSADAHPAHSSTVIEALSALLSNKECLIQPFMQQPNPQGLATELVVDIMIAFYACDIPTHVYKTLATTQANMLSVITEFIRFTPVPAVLGVVNLVIEGAQYVEDFESEEAMPVLHFLLGVLHAGGVHEKLRVLRTLSLSRSARERDKRPPWNPGRFLRIIRERDMDDDLWDLLDGIPAEERASARFVKVLNAGADVMRAFGIHRDTRKLSILWWQLVWEEPRCRHFDRACGRRFGYGTRSARSCGFPFDAWEDTFLHCAAVLRTSPLAELEPYRTDEYCNCRSPDDFADVLQIQYHLQLSQMAEAEALVASARARNRDEVWFMYALSELGAEGALAAVEELAQELEPLGELIDVGWPMNDRILRNCYSGVFADLLRGGDPSAAPEERTPGKLLENLTRMYRATNSKRTCVRWIAADSPDIAWQNTIAGIMSYLIDILQPGGARGPGPCMWEELSPRAEKAARLADHLYGDLTAFPYWLSSMLRKHSATACKTWDAFLGAIFHFGASWASDEPDPVQLPYERVFERADLVEWNRRIFDARGRSEPIAWSKTPGERPRPFLTSAMYSDSDDEYDEGGFYLQEYQARETAMPPLRLYDPAVYSIKNAAHQKILDELVQLHDTKGRDYQAPPERELLRARLDDPAQPGSDDWRRWRFFRFFREFQGFHKGELDLSGRSRAVRTAVLRLWCMG
ncbi:hypothetical protein AURDEDRAFT_126290 [Auricularia subglabra TFB-10046 SS5]|nr:hypothetical protein AURDEDRAFT_126290 [Auricularia subglabra TFB-10046 SS5]